MTAPQSTDVPAKHSSTDLGGGGITQHAEQICSDGDGVEPRQTVRGVDLDLQSRCAHYNSPADIIAIKMKCCGTYYACKDCHYALAEHSTEVWPREEWDSTAVLCGACGTEMTIRQYLDCSNQCTGCGAHFNPGCRNHYHFYFAAT